MCKTIIGASIRVFILIIIITLLLCCGDALRIAAAVRVALPPGHVAGARDQKCRVHTALRRHNRHLAPAQRGVLP